MPRVHDLTDEMLAFWAERHLCTVTTLMPDGRPHVVPLGVALDPVARVAWAITSPATQKVANLRRDPNVSAVIGFTDEGTLQYEGVADEPAGEDLARIQHVYFEAFPDGPSRLTWAGITYVRIRPSWLKFTSYTDAAKNTEMVF